MVKISELQSIIIGYLKSLSIDKENILAIMLVLKSEEQQMEMAWFLHDNRMREPTQSEVTEKALQIAGIL